MLYRTLQLSFIIVALCASCAASAVEDAPEASATKAKNDLYSQRKDAGRICGKTDIVSGGLKSGKTATNVKVCAANQCITFASIGIDIGLTTATLKYTQPTGSLPPNTHYTFRIDYKMQSGSERWWSELTTAKDPAVYIRRNIAARGDSGVSTSGFPVTGELNDVDQVLIVSNADHGCP